jgi:hypothetical protein
VVQCECHMCLRETDCEYTEDKKNNTSMKMEAYKLLQWLLLQDRLSSFVPLPKISEWYSKYVAKLIYEADTAIKIIYDQTDICVDVLSVIHSYLVLR